MPLLKVQRGRNYASIKLVVAETIQDVVNKGMSFVLIRIINLIFDFVIKVILNLIKAKKKYRFIYLDIHSSIILFRRKEIGHR